MEQIRRVEKADKLIAPNEGVKVLQVQATQAGIQG